MGVIQDTDTIASSFCTSSRKLLRHKHRKSILLFAEILHTKGI